MMWIILISIFICAIGITLSIAGLVFSILGFKSQSNKGKAKVGLALNIVGCVLPWVVMGFLLVLALTY